MCPVTIADPDTFPATVTYAQTINMWTKTCQGKALYIDLLIHPRPSAMCK